MKKILLVVAVLAVLLGAGFGIKTAYDKKNENIVTTQPATGQDDAEAADENEVYYLTGQITEITDEYIILEGTEQGTVQVNLFDDTAFSINEGEKVGLIGINGTGKSTLLKIVAGLEEPDDGSVVRRRNLYVRYLPQIPVFTAGDTVLDAIAKAKPAAAKGTYIKSCVVASTMGPGIKVSTAKMIG